MGKVQNATHTLLPFSLIEAATTGNVDAINAVLSTMNYTSQRWQPDVSMTKMMHRICASIMNFKEKI